MLRRENNLAVIRARLVRRPDADAFVEFEAQIGDGHAHDIATWPVGDLGPRSGGIEWVRELPVEVADAIRRGSDELVERSAVWLELAEPVGFLPLLPWEAMLSPVLQRPVLRLPYFLLRPRAAADSLDVVLCASSPLAKTQFDTGRTVVEIAHRIAASVPRKVTLHLFSDAEAQSQLRRADDIEAEIRVYDPARVADYRLARRTPRLDDSYEVVNPWLLWIRDSMEGRAVDVVHFVCHGYQSSGRGALSFASSPVVNTDTEYSRFVGLGQLTSFLNQVGAWSFAVTGPRDNYSMAGLRELGDSVARTAPRYVLVHDSELDPGPEYAELGAEYAFLYQTEQTPQPPRARSVSCWVHPKLVEYTHLAEPEDEALLASDGRTVVFGFETEQMIDDDATPAWLAATVRTVERLQAKWLNQSGVLSESAVNPDAAAVALHHVTAFLNEQVLRERGRAQP